QLIVLAGDAAHAVADQQMTTVNGGILNAAVEQGSRAAVSAKFWDCRRVGHGANSICDVQDAERCRYVIDVCQITLKLRLADEHTHSQTVAPNLFVDLDEDIGICLRDFTK